MNLNIVNKLKKSGITSISQCLNENQINFLGEKIKKFNKSKGDSGSHLPISYLSIFIKILKLQFKDIILGLYLKRLSKKLNLKQIASDFFDTESELIDADVYISEKSNSPVLDWHVDRAYSGKKNVTEFVKADDFGLRFIFYLTDVDRNNGCLKYVPFSNKVAFALKKGIYENKIKYLPYWKKSDFCKMVNSNEKYISNEVNSETLENFKKQIKKLEKSNDPSEFSYEIKKGGAVVFDESGLHKGTEPKNNDRLVFRYIYKKVKQ